MPLAVKLVEVLSDALIEAQEQSANNGDYADDDDDDDGEDDGWNDNDFKSGGSLFPVLLMLLW